MVRRRRSSILNVRRSCRSPRRRGFALVDVIIGGMLLSIGLAAIISMATRALKMQTDGEKMFILPAWPKDWDVDFRLHAPRRTVLEGKVRGGKMVDLKVTPAWRKKDVILPDSP